MHDHEKYMKLALVEARRALDRGDFPAGCVIVDEVGIVVGACRAHSVEQSNELDHAEMLTLRKAAEKGMISGDKALTVYSVMEPCLMCFSALILNNVRTIVYAYEDVMGGGTNLSLEYLSPLYASMKIQIIPRILRGESLLLFREFFSNPENPYWKDSLLCRHTLAQGEDQGRKALER